MGNFIRPLSERASYIASDDLWIEGLAIQQLQTTAAMPGMVSVVGMPDLHPGRGYPVGAAFFSTGCFYPALVGNDIGCGMGLWQTSMTLKQARLDKLEKRLSGLGDFAATEWLETYALSSMQQHPFYNSLGSIGGGNHFAELQAVDTVYNSDEAEALSIDASALLLLVHSGSRGLGQAILRDHVERFGHRGLLENGEDAKQYLDAHRQALGFAEENRRLIALRMLEQIRTEGQRIVDVHHNLVEPSKIGGSDGWLHRKGATPSDRGAVIIPGSRGDYSYLVKPRLSESSLHSLAHGAGRKWMRSDCKNRLSARFTPEQLSRTAMGSRVICQDRQLIYEEAPQAYKSIDSVVDTLTGAGLVVPIARLKPMLTYKTSGGKSE
ncbi:RNA ligase RtcB family protein [Leminorella grimontii]|uniref:3'-phosphate/5'-hydroxy nucleic acid ligase n=1 Tax=Leminorella grimontii TaxID=82981 RepID=A0AAV5MWH2_9GAMM|nr:RNA ligase RtcB family protein [Leminorella grimontii]KFC95635.1 RtcB family protein [Leminorella grimontii ATCC 33999 = DSM 5078]GKX54186.1 RNA ligase RtcB family protein [Leminorella grimontii]VFS59829.1 RNA-splicing ligase RtcB [Leminorella grimontii]